MADSVAVIGGGVAGITAAHILQKKYDVTLFESNNYVGGHTNTVIIPSGPDRGTAVDTGFIVCNDRTYPTFHSLLKQLGVPVRYADMSFSVVDEKSRLQYGSAGINTIFAQRSNIINPSFLKFLIGIQQFWQIAKRDVERSEVHDMPLGDYLAEHNIPQRVIDDFIIPISAAIWSTPDALMLDFPVGIFLKFYSNHGLLSVVNQPKWQTVIGGSFSYVKAFQKLFRGSIFIDSPVLGISRDESGIQIRLKNGQIEKFHYAVIATHADEAFRLLEDPSEDERKNLACWKYLINDTLLHTDDTFLPSNKRAWASWNYRREFSEDGTRPLSITYHMNRLQGLSTTHQYSVTLNSRKTIDPDKVVARYKYTHPHFTVESMRTQSAIMKMNGARKTFFCGSYLGFGFHEDAVKSSVEALKDLGVEL